MCRFREIVTADVSNAVPETIDVNKSTFHSSILHPLRVQRFKSHHIVNRVANLVRTNAHGNGSRNRRKNIAAVKSGTNRLAKVFFVCYMERPEIRFFITNVTENSVVWTHK